MFLELLCIILQLLFLYDCTYILRRRLYCTNASASISVIWFCSNRLKDKHTYVIFCYVQMCSLKLIQLNNVVSTCNIVYTIAIHIILLIYNQWSMQISTRPQQFQINCLYIIMSSDLECMCIIVIEKSYLDVR